MSADDKPDSTPDGKPASKTDPRVRLGLGLVLLVLIGIWIAYAIGMLTRSDDALADFRNGTFWPADSYMTVAQSGFAIQIFGHLMFTFIGGTFVALLVQGLFWLVKRAGGPDLRGYVAVPVYLVVCVYTFLVFRGVPERVTVIDESARTLTVRELAPWMPLRSTTETIRAESIEAIGLRVGVFGYRDEEPVVRIYVSRTQGELLLLGLRPCPNDVAQCAALGDEGIQALVQKLGRRVESVASSDSGRSRAHMLAK